jgi:hypothetical protein
MTDIIRLEPHDALPDHGTHALVIRRFGEDDPNAVVTEIDFFGRHRTMSVAVGEDGKPLPWEDVVQGARREAQERGYATLYAVDRTAGRREQEVLAHHGDHSLFSGELSDTDEEDGVTGTTMLDRPNDAGFFGKFSRPTQKKN